MEREQNPRVKARGEGARAHPQQTGTGSLAGPGWEVGERERGNKGEMVDLSNFWFHSSLR